MKLALTIETSLCVACTCLSVMPWLCVESESESEYEYTYNFTVTSKYLFRFRVNDIYQKDIVKNIVDNFRW